MWLDRFSGHSTPSQSPPPTSRTPRRSLQIQRPIPPSRASSLSQTASSAKPHLFQVSGGSRLKEELGHSPPFEVEEPLIALRRLLTTDSEQRTAIAASKELVSSPTRGLGAYSVDYHFGSRSLHNVVDEQTGTEDESAADGKHDHDLRNASDSYGNLHQSIAECDGMLGSVERYLSSFQADLAAVSAAIETLQSRSLNLNSKLQNRRIVERLLSPVVEKVSLPPKIVKKISEGPIDEAWARCLEDLQVKLSMIDSDEAQLLNTQVSADLKPLLDDLSNRAVERIRDYFASRIRALRSPNVNAQILQQQDFLKFKQLFAFLAQRQPQLAEQISRAYVNTMRWYYVTNFGRYHDALTKLKTNNPPKNEALLGEVLPSAQTSNNSGTAISNALADDPFSLGRRVDVLRHLTNVALPAYAAEESKNVTHLELPFMHMNMALLDNASAEYTFLTAFLPSALFSPTRVSQQLSAIFGPTFESGYNCTKDLIKDCVDALGILLMVRLNQHFAFTLQRRRIPTLDSYVNGTAMLLWPRFQQVLDAQCDSLRRLTASVRSRASGSPGGAASAAFASLHSTGSSSRSGFPSTSPHKLTQRFATFLRGILALSADTRDDEPVGNSVGRLREAFDSWMTKMAQGYPPGDRGRREKERFVSSNYGLIAAVLEGSDVTGRLADDCRAHFESARGIV